MTKNCRDAFRKCFDHSKRRRFGMASNDLANVGVRDEFLLGIFSPDHGGNHTPPPTPPAIPHP